jgi:hypothetical protein
LVATHGPHALVRPRCRTGRFATCSRLSRAQFCLKLCDCELVQLQGRSRLLHLLVRARLLLLLLVGGQRVLLLIG